MGGGGGFAGAFGNQKSDTPNYTKLIYSILPAEGGGAGGGFGSREMYTNKSWAGFSVGAPTGGAGAWDLRRNSKELNIETTTSLAPMKYR